MPGLRLGIIRRDDSLGSERGKTRSAQTDRPAAGGGLPRAGGRQDAAVAWTAPVEAGRARAYRGRSDWLVFAQRQAGREAGGRLEPRGRLVAPRRRLRGRPARRSNADRAAALVEGLMHRFSPA